MKTKRKAECQLNKLSSEKDVMNMMYVIEETYILFEKLKERIIIIFSKNTRPVNLATY